MEYHDQPLQFISSHYFQLRNKHDVIYNAIEGIMTMITYLPVVMVPLISCLTIIYIYPIISHHVDQYSKINQKDLKLSSKTDVQMSKLINFHQKRKKVHLFSLFLTNCVVTILLVILHIFSAINFITYGSEILHDDHHKLLYMYSGLSCLLIGTMLTVAILVSICRWGKSSLVGISISVNIVYIASYFFPPMVLAFIQDPMQVILTCLMMVVVVAFVYKLLWSFGLFVLFKIIHGIAPFSRWSYKTLINFVISLFTAFSLLFYFFLIRCMFTLGSFSDFQSLQNMFLPLLVVLLSIFILKPGYKYVCKTMSSDVTTEMVNIRSHVDEVHISLDKSDSDTEIEEIHSQNDEDTIV